MQQTLPFLQKPDLGLSRDQILDESEQDDGSIIVHVRKQYNDKSDVAEYFV